jgi:hypothetical protein
MRHLIAFAWLIGAASVACQSGQNGLNNPSNDAGTNGMLCHVCQHDPDCGDGNYCLPDPGGGNTCGTSCNSDSDCPDNYWCNDVNGSDGKRVGGACRPANWGSCSSVHSGSDGSTNTNDDAGTNPGNDAAVVNGDASTGPPDTGFVPCTNDTWSNYTQSLFSNNCVRCHSMYNTLSSVQTDGLSIKNDVQSGRMPTDTHLPAVDIMRTARWIDCDMPQ